MAVSTSARPLRLLPDPVEPGHRARSPHRGDIQGLRAVAVLAVVLDHAGVGWAGGGYVGVDVFFVVSGFVITGSLLGAEHRDGISLPAFYAARARRILPMSTVVLVATVLASWLLLNVVRAGTTATDALWATFFGANFRFSALGTDYFAAGLAQSPLRHYWSLAVEEQFYLAWPVLLAVLLARRPGRGGAAAERARPLGRVAVALGVLIVVSLLWSVRQTADLPTAAYYSPLTRAWELGIGALLAVGAGTVARVPGSVRAALSWAGCAGIGLAVVLFSAGTPFPGTAALLPVLATAAVIAGGTGVGRGGAGRLLAAPPLRVIGDRSYSFYLWHWPVLVLAEGYAQRSLSVPAKLGLVLLALALSVGSYWLVETPFRTAARLRADRSTSLLLWPASIALLVCTCVGVTTTMQRAADARAVAVDDEAPPQIAVAGATPVAAPVPAGEPAAAVQAAVRAAGAGDPLPTALSPAVQRVSKDFNYTVCYTPKGQSEGKTCTYGDLTAKRSIGIIGDSHAMMWFPALDQIGRTHGWAVHTFFKPSCNAVDVTPSYDGRTLDRACQQWRSWAIKTAAAMKLDRILVSNYPGQQLDGNGDKIADPAAWDRAWTAGVASTARTLKASGATVTFLGDAPGLAETSTECLLRRGARMSTCTFDRNPEKARRNLATRAGAREAGIGYIDVDDWFCAAGRCPAVIGKRIAYQDDNHVSRTYSLHLAEPLATRVKLR